MSRTPVAVVATAALAAGLLSFAAPALAGPPACDKATARAIHTAEEAAGSAPVAGSTAAGAVHRVEAAAC